ncbi:MAG: hypothetical protein U1E60_29615 [Reyranellaceae bacterium]
MAYTFESKFFGEKPMQKLLGAANENPLHIVPGSSGDHVSKIQEALFQITSANIDADELGKSLYGTSTASAVANFKRTRKPPILNYKNEIDDIVGIKTMQALDQEMKRIDGGLGKKTVVRTQDIVIHILGQDPTLPAAGKKTSAGQTFIGVPPTDIFNKNVETAAYLEKHERLIHQQWNGGLPQFKNDPTAEIVEFINKTVAGLAPGTLGRVILIGMSSGGRNVTTVCDQIKGRRLFSYVAAIDAAFNDKSDPAIKSAVSATRSENFFQTVGNDILPGSEFHTSIPGFQQNIKLDNFPSLEKVAAFLRTAATHRVKEGLVNQAHEIAVRHGYASAKTTALALLAP